MPVGGRRRVAHTPWQAAPSQLRRAKPSGSPPCFLLEHTSTHARTSTRPAAGAVGTKGCNCTDAYKGAPGDVVQMYTLACDFCSAQDSEIADPVPLPGLDGFCTTCLFSGPVPSRCDEAQMP